MLSRLPVASSVGAATVEPATMESAATMTYVAAVESATVKASAVEATAMKAGVPMEATFTVPSAGAEVVPTTIVATAVESASTIETVEPRASADKYPAGKVIRTVIPVRRAGVWRVPIVSVSTDRSRPNIGRCCIDRPHTESDSNPYLSVGSPRSCHRHEKPEHDSVF